MTPDDKKNKVGESGCSQQSAGSLLFMRLLNDNSDFFFQPGIFSTDDFMGCASYPVTASVVEIQRNKEQSGPNMLYINVA